MGITSFSFMWTASRINSLTKTTITASRAIKMGELDTPPPAIDTEPSAEALTPPSEEQLKAGGRPEAFKSTIQEILFVLTATMAMGMSSFLFGAGTVITAQIGRDLHMTSAQITWINASSSYIFTFTV
jgi:hypothetical protein